MLGNQLFIHEWGVWFCFLGEPNESNEKYYENFRQVFTFKGPADLAFCWNQFGLNNLDNFLVTSQGTQQRYYFFHLGTRSRIGGDRSTQSSTSRRVLSQNGKILTIRKEDALSSQSVALSKTKTKSTLISSSSCSERTLTIANTSVGSASSRPKTLNLSSEWRSGLISLMINCNC